MAFSAANETRDRAMPVRARKARRSHEIMIQRSVGGGRNVNFGWVDEVFAEHDPDGPGFRFRDCRFILSVTVGCTVDSRR